MKSQHPRRTPIHCIRGGIASNTRGGDLDIAAGDILYLGCDISPHRITGGGDMLHGVNRYIATGGILYEGLDSPTVSGGGDIFQVGSDLSAGDILYQGVI